MVFVMEAMIEQGVAIDFLVGAVIHFSTTDKAASMLVHNANVQIFNLDALLQKRADSICEILRRSAKGKCR